MNRHTINNHILERFHKFLNENEGAPLVVIFDIGTNANRILIAPKRVPSGDSIQWIGHPYLFNDSGFYLLGEDVDRANKLSTRSHRLGKTISFIRFYVRELLEKGNLKKEDVHLFGTEIFRWLSNQDEVLNHFHKETGFPLTVLSEDEESYLSLISLQYTVGYTAEAHHEAPNVSDYDLVFLIDQGGGSTEVSYFDPKTPNIYEHKSIGKFGTQSLRDRFFDLDKQGNAIDPKHSQFTIPDQIDSLDSYIESILENWDYFEKTKDTKKLFYGMGSALHDMFKGKNSLAHNRNFSLNKIDDRIENLALNLNKFPKVSDLYALTRDDKLSESDKSKFKMFCGLPVYSRILQKFGVEEIQLAGFGLRYGIYIYLYAHLRAQLAKKEFPNIPIAYKTGSEGT